jgi:hypothetical protein
MAGANGRQKPFEITIGKVKVLDKNQPKFEQNLKINGIEFTADPREFLSFFSGLLSNDVETSAQFIVSSGPESLKLLAEARVAFMAESGHLKPTPEFKLAASDFMSFLAKPTFDPAP